MLKPSLPPSLLLSLSMALPVCQATETAGQAEPSLVDFSLEQLADIVVTSVSRQQTRLAEASASIDVIGAVDIRRAGAALPEALRLAPNLQVARADARTCASGPGLDTSRHLTLSLTGQNLLHRSHRQSGARRLVERAVQVKMASRF